MLPRGERNRVTKKWAYILETGEEGSWGEQQTERGRWLGEEG